MITYVTYGQLHCSRFYYLITIPMLQIVSVMQVFGNVTFLPLGIGSDKGKKFAIAHGVSVQLKRRDLNWCTTCADGGGWDGYRCAAAEHALGLQPSDLGEWLR